MLEKIIKSVIVFLNKNLNNYKNNNYDYKQNYNYDYSESTNYYNVNIKNNYIQKKFMTNCEYEFYLKIIELEKDYKIVPQINLATIIKKETNNERHNELFRNIDFGIFTKDYSQLLVLIELNDKTHNRTDRKQRDMKVNTICYHAGIRLLTFYTQCKNSNEYIINRILTEINKTKKEL